MTDKDIAIKVENLTKTYKLYDAPIDRLKESLYWRGKKYHKDFYALNDVSFEIKKGETVGIIGKNGSGKSTLLKIITGVLTPTNGKVTVNGRVSALLELGAGFNPEYTGLENIYFQGAIMGYERHEIDAKIDEILAFADIGDFIHQAVKTYSSGMFARLAFAVAISIDPDILIIDEALSVGDAAFQIKCYNKMEQIRSNGATILFVSHDTYSIRTMCSKAVFLSAGSNLFYGDSNIAVNRYLQVIDAGAEQIIVNADVANDAQEKVVEKTVNDNIKHKDIAISKLEKNTLGVVENYLKLNFGSSFSVSFEVANLSSEEIKVCYVFNLYRVRDRTYVCGATSLMDLKKNDVLEALKRKEVTLTFDSISLLSGDYTLRLAVNDSSGLGIFCDLKDAVKFSINDEHQSEGLLHINRSWEIR